MQILEAQEKQYSGEEVMKSKGRRNFDTDVIIRKGGH